MVAITVSAVSHILTIFFERQNRLTSKSEWAVEIIPPCSVYATPAEEDQETKGDEGLDYADEVEGIGFDWDMHFEYLEMAGSVTITREWRRRAEEVLKRKFRASMRSKWVTEKKDWV